MSSIDFYYSTELIIGIVRHPKPSQVFARKATAYLGWSLQTGAAISRKINKIKIHVTSIPGDILTPEASTLRTGRRRDTRCVDEESRPGVDVI